VSSNYFLPTLYDVADLSGLLPSFKDVPGLSSSYFRFRSQGSRNARKAKHVNEITAGATSFLLRYLRSLLH
jgi:hypothetical protein